MKIVSNQMVFYLLKNLEYSFWKHSKNSLKSNQKYKNIHKGETCYILGNGGSLKYFDLSVLSNLVTMGCTYSLVDKRLEESGLNYCVFPSAYLMSPLWKNRVTGKIQFNSLKPIFKKIIKDNKKTQFFISLTDKYSFLRPPSNINFVYHFGNKNSNTYDISGKFSIVTGGLDFMLGIAKYLGFSRVVLIGCDYLGFPSMDRHFYSNNKPILGNYKDDYIKRISKVAKNLELDVLTIFPEGINSPDFESKSFTEYFGVDENYHNQSEIIDDSYLRLLKKADSKIQLYL